MLVGWGYPLVRSAVHVCHQDRHVVVEPAVLPLSPVCWCSATRVVVEPTMALSSDPPRSGCAHCVLIWVLAPFLSPLYRFCAVCAVVDPTVVRPTVVEPAVSCLGYSRCRSFLSALLGSTVSSSLFSCRRWSHRALVVLFTVRPTCRGCAVRVVVDPGLSASSSTPPCRARAVRVVVDPAVSCSGCPPHRRPRRVVLVLFVVGPTCRGCAVRVVVDPAVSCLG